MRQQLRVALPDEQSPVIRRYMDVFARLVAERCGTEVVPAADECDVRLEIRPGIGAEGFAIEDAPGGVCIAGNDERGLLYGIGKFLRTACYGEDSIVPDAWRGTSVPERDFRKIYFATHFHNFYHDAPEDAITRYIEEIMLWGYNGVVVWFDMHHFNGIGDPDAQAMLDRLRVLLRVTKDLGMDTGLMVLGNEAYATSPEELRADWKGNQNGYTSDLLAHYHVELCPNKTGAAELILRWLDEELAAFEDIGVDVLSIWPYDQGGCTCEKCAPWGGNGLLTIGEQMARVFRQRYPGGKVSISTWWFDYAYPGEWEAFAKASVGRLGWVDYLMVDAHCERPFPPYPLEHGVPEGLPMVNFPEISMYEAYPWGGYGMNPFPRRLQELWDSSKRLVAGGFPYSEGIYEDMNKAISAQFYWNDRPALDTVREYLAYHFGADVADNLAGVVDIYERTLGHGYGTRDGQPHITMPVTAGVGDALALVQAAEAAMTAHARRNWRWRLFALRAVIDTELAAHHGEVSDHCNTAFRELIEIYHAENAQHMVAPPVRTQGAEKKAEFV